MRSVSRQRGAGHIETSVQVQARTRLEPARTGRARTPMPRPDPMLATCDALCMVTTMRAALYEHLGAPDVLKVKEIARPEPGPGEVRVRVAVSGVNPTDWKTRAAGSGKAMPYSYVVPNQDGAGEIDAVGGDVDLARVGERVWMWFGQWQRQHGTAAEWICLPSRQAVRMQDRASFDLGASLGIPALTAAHALFIDGPIEGKTVLVSGGAGAVGHYAIELARWRGARVIATASSADKVKLAHAAGADAVINYNAEDAAGAIRAAAPGGVDRVIEVAPSNLVLDHQVMVSRGTAVFYAATSEDPPLPVRALMTLNSVCRFMLIYTVAADELSRAVSTVSNALEAGVLTELPVHRFTLDEIASAHQAVEDGAVGKVLVDVGHRREGLARG